ncbi:MAG: peptide ABC transporter substrate-binding protein [Candidatus Eremiobacteraeota bacterium]|nr:peptide ABC transporter substrate-binding protein [Candidatus Eremiobacteraeota bacterium]
MMRSTTRWAYAAGAILLVSCALAGCTKISQSTTAPGGAGGGSIPGVLRYADISEPDSLNPLLSTQIVTADLEYLAFSFFFNVDDKLNFVPEVALEVPTQANGGISKDGLTITYHLRRGIKWQDGEPLTAKDVVFTFHAIMNPANNVQVRTGYDQIASVDAPNDDTVVVHMKRVYAPIVAYFMGQQGQEPVLPAHLLAQYPNINQIPYNTLPIGSGPFKITEWQHGDHITLVANPGYWRGPPKLSKIVFRFVSSTNTIKVLLQTHEIDAWFRADPNQYDQLDKIAGYKVMISDQNVFAHIDFNFKDPLLTDLRVRKAIEYALDRKAMAHDLTYDVYQPANSDIAPYSWAYPHDLPYYDNNPAAARALLDEAGWKVGPDGVREKNGQKLELQFSYISGNVLGAKVGTVAAARLRDIGVILNQKVYPAPLYFGSQQAGGIVNSGKYQLGYFGWVSGVDPDNSSLYACDQFPPDGQNNLFWCDKKLDDAEKAALATFDQTQRAQQYSIIEHELVEQVPTIFLFHDRRLDIVRNGFGNYIPSPATSSFWNSWQWTMQ